MRPAGILLVALVGLAVLACSAAAPAASDAPGRTSAPPGPSGPSGPPGMPVVHVADLPAEAAEALDLIAAGGPFPYRQDGATFQNRERLLPAAEAGYYREYTVPTPGEDDRGARRIVTGAEGERYWTADHYDSFAWIVP